MDWRWRGWVGVMTLAGLGGGVAHAELPDDKTERLKTYSERHFELSFPSTASYEIRRGPGTGTHSIRVGDPELVRAAGAEDLVARVDAASFQRMWPQLGWGLLFPLGLYVAVDNFFGKPRATTVPTGLPGPLVSFFPASHAASFALMVAGATGAAFGASQWGAFVTERLGWSWPNLMEPDDARRAVELANDRLLDELALSRADVATPSALAGATPAPGATPATPAATTSAAPKGEPGTAFGHLAAAEAALKAQHGGGFQPYLLLTSDLADTTGKLPRGSWRYLFFHPLRQETWQVEVPIDGAPPKIGAAPEAFKDYRLAQRWLEQVRLDSPRAMRLLESEVVRRRPLMPEEATLLLYPFYGPYQAPLWILDLGNGPAEVGIGIDAASGQLVDLGAGARTTSPGMPGR